MSNLLTPDDLAEEFGVPVSTVMLWNRDNGWPHVRVGRRIRWTPEQLEEILRRQSVTPAKAPKLPGQTSRSARRSA